jgi:YHS domain-containing protein
MKGRTVMSKTVGAFVFGLALFLSSTTLRADEKEKKFDNPEAGKCPVSQKDINPKCTTEIDKKTYAFCCGKCMAKFKESPEKFLKKDEKK